MTKIILEDGTEEFVSPGEARKRCESGEAKMVQFVPTYTTRELRASPVKEEAKPKRKRRTKAEIEADEAAAESAKDASE